MSEGFRFQLALQPIDWVFPYRGSSLTELRNPAKIPETFSPATSPEHFFYFSIIYGMSSFPLTNSYFSRWLKPPTSLSHGFPMKTLDLYWGFPCWMTPLVSHQAILTDLESLEGTEIRGFWPQPGNLVEEVGTSLEIYIYTHIHTYTYLYIYIHMHIYIYTYIHIYIFTYLHIYIYTYLHIYIYTYIHIYMYAYMHIYIYTYIHIYIYIYL